MRRISSNDRVERTGMIGRDDGERSGPAAHDGRYATTNKLLAAAYGKE